MRVNLRRSRSNPDRPFSYRSTPGPRPGRLCSASAQGIFMSLESLKTVLPEYAKDLRLNLGSLAGEPALSDEVRAGTFIASALASRNPTVTAAVLAEFAPRLSPEALNAAKSAASIMAMNNIYYRFTHLVGGDYPTLPARLRMNVMANPAWTRRPSSYGRWPCPPSTAAACAWKAM